MKKEITQPISENFEIKVQAMVPCDITYRVRATSVEEALKQLEKNPPISFKPHLMRKKLTKATVYTAGTIMVRATRTFK